MIIQGSFLTRQNDGAEISREARWGEKLSIVVEFAATVVLSLKIYLIMERIDGVKIGWE